MAVTLILGASNKPNRFSYKAQQKLLKHGHQVIPVTPKGGKIGDIKCFTDLTDIHSSVDTVTIYINPSLLGKELDKIVALNPRRVIFNPGTESKEAAQKLRDHGIEVNEQCTLIMLDSNIY